MVKNHLLRSRSTGALETSMESGQHRVATTPNPFATYANAIYRQSSGSQMQSVNVSTFMLHVLNVFPLKSLYTNVVRAINMRSTLLWRKIQTHCSLAYLPIHSS
jgi:hypothetical protein